MIVKYSKAALKFLAKADKPTITRIRAAVQGLTHTPPEGDIKVMLAWDPDFTKVTEQERKDIENAEQSGFVDENAIDWDNLSNYE